MTHCIYSILAGLVLTLVLQGCGHAQQSIPSLATAPATVDEEEASLAVVRKFYRHLIQESPPTLEQELEVFERSFRSDFAPHGTSDKEPVVYNFLRSRREWFLPSQAGHHQLQSPDNQEAVLAEIRLAIVELRWTAADDERRDPVTRFVLAVFAERDGAPARNRSVVFPIIGNKISAPAIAVGGFGGHLVQDTVLGLRKR
jgi:hypothetical protein